MKDQVIMIDLDAIFDTRIGVIAQKDPLLAAKLVISNAYRERKNADWGAITGGAITREQFNEMYSKRDKETLKHSAITHMPRIVGDFTKSLQWKGIVKIEVDKVSIKINTWPYKFTSDEKRELRDCMAQYTSATSTIEYVHVSLEKMTPAQMDRLADIWITYSYDEWMTLHIENLTRFRIPMMTLLAPEILYSPENIMEGDLVDKELNGEYDPFKVHQVAMCEFLGVEFYPPFTFSTILD